MPTMIWVPPALPVALLLGCLFLARVERALDRDAGRTVCRTPRGRSRSVENERVDRRKLRAGSSATWSPRHLRVVHVGGPREAEARGHDVEIGQGQARDRQAQRVQGP